MDLSSPQAGRPDRKAVAALAGVSEATVSNVLTGTRSVAPATRAKVESAIQALGYTVNRAARTLRTGTPQTLGVVLPNIANPFYAILLQSITRLASQSGYAVIAADSGDDPETEHRCLAALAGRVTGIIVAPAGDAASLQRWSTAIPTVILDRPTEGDDFSVVADSEAGALRATRHLISHGCERIGFIAGPEAAGSTRARMAGWQAALAEADLTHTQPTFGSFTQAEGYRQAMSLNLLDFDGLLVNSDEQARGVIRAAWERGRTVGSSELRIISFDGLSESRYAIPSLSTVVQPINELALHAVLGAVANSPSPSETGIKTSYEAMLITRESCGCDGPGTPASGSGLPAREPGAAIA